MGAQEKHMPLTKVVPGRQSPMAKSVAIQQRQTSIPAKTPGRPRCLRSAVTGAVTGPVLLYSKPGCPYCQKAKAALKQKGLAFTDIPVTDRLGNAVTLPDGRTSYTVPQMYLPVGGFDNMANWL